MMDRPLDSWTLRRDRLGRVARIVLPILGVAALLVWLPGWIRPSVNRARIRTAPVTTGPIDAVITEAQANLFTPFFSTKPNGQGIGLTLVQEILAGHGFDYALEHAPGDPTRFTIVF